MALSWVVDCSYYLSFNDSGINIAGIRFYLGFCGTYAHPLPSSVYLVFAVAWPWSETDCYSHTFRYEDLVENPQKAVQALSNFFGLTPTKSEFERCLSAMGKDSQVN